jgi:L-ascorbate metabolism protein UlaG (beta-lactamase superfamily)
MKKLLGIAVAALALLAGEAMAQGKTTVLWLGQSAVRITTPGGKVIVVDPYLSKNPKTPAAWKNPAALGHVDIVLVTHAHGDHLGDAPEIAKMNNAPLWAPQGLSAALAALGVVPENLAKRMGPGGSIAPFGPGGVRITMVHAEHNSELVWENPATKKTEVHYGGQPCGFIIEMENGFKIYHTGDTGLFGDMKLIGEYYKPDLVLIPVGGGPAVIDPTAAAYAVREFIKPKFAIPIHYGTNPLLVGTPQEFIAALGSTSTKVITMNPGDQVDF